MSAWMRCVEVESRTGETIAPVGGESTRREGGGKEVAAKTVSLGRAGARHQGELTNIGDEALHVHLLDILKRRDVNPELLRACVMRRVVGR